MSESHETTDPTTDPTLIYGYPAGAWAYGFLRKKPAGQWMTGTANDRLGIAILAFKYALNAQGYGPLVTTTPAYGNQVADIVTKIQQDNGLLPPTYSAGTLGPDVAAIIWRKPTADAEKKYNIPDQWLAHIKSLESANDPVAIGILDHGDRGLLQINAQYHPDVSDAEAFDPYFALDFGGQYLQTAYNHFKDWEVAVASFNVGYGGAQQWQASGKAATGGPGTWPALYDRATHYVSVVRSSTI